MMSEELVMLCTPGIAMNFYRHSGGLMMFISASGRCGQYMQLNLKKPVCQRILNMSAIFRMLNQGTDLTHLMTTVRVEP